MLQLSVLVLLILTTLTQSQTCTFPKGDVTVCDEGFVAHSPQRFIQEERFEPGQFELDSVPANGSKGKWFYESREKPGRIVSVKRKFKGTGVESYKATGDNDFPHNFTLAISRDKLIPGKYVYRTESGASCAFFVY